jgi:ribosomal peptide maturation radical SAM protein 1
VALLRNIKYERPQTITVIGGPNCAGEMAQGIASLDPRAKWIDYIYSGESEESFVGLLRSFSAGRLPKDRIVYGRVCQNLDTIPLPQFHEFFEQLSRWLDPTQVRADRCHLVYETSRGCWWAERHQCTFCGLNGPNLRFRSKSPAKVRRDLKELREDYATRTVLLSDNITPAKTFDTILTASEDSHKDLNIVCSHRVPLSLKQVLELHEAGFQTVEVGIESLSSDLLKLMHKGVLARQNVALLRYARSAGMNVYWNILWGLPGDKLTMYQQMLELIPMIVHLQPPYEVLHLMVSRFSPYFEQPETYGVRNLRPIDSYAEVLPAYADVDKIAAQFAADYACDSHENLTVIVEMMEQASAWWARWTSPNAPPALLQVIRLGQEYVLFDTRGLPDTQPAQVLSSEQASAALAPQPTTATDAVAWALEARTGVLLDGRHTPLATAEPGLIGEFEAVAGREGHL